jgi:type IV pilus assembly protein PilM
MANSFPPDFIILDSESLVHARVARRGRGAELLALERHRLAPETFLAGGVSPSLQNGASLAEALGRVKVESGRLERVAILVPDSWLRMTLLTLPSLPASRGEADEVVRWALKRSLPVDPGELRMTYDAIERNGTGVRTLVIAVLEKLLDGIEEASSRAGIQSVVVESIGLNIWNAVAARLAPATRLFVHARETDFTTALFRGAQPMFLRSRALSGGRRLEQEMRLSASYLASVLQGRRVEECILTGSAAGQELEDAIRTEFEAPVQRLAMTDFVQIAPGIDVAGMESEIVACAGVFAE